MTKATIKTKIKVYLLQDRKYIVFYIFINWSLSILVYYNRGMGLAQFSVSER